LTAEQQVNFSSNCLKSININLSRY